MYPARRSALAQWTFLRDVLRGEAERAGQSGGGHDGKDFLAWLLGQPRGAR